MDPLEALSNEHGLIRQYLDNLTLAAERIEAGKYPSPAFFEKSVEFARDFADKFHHFKEELVLFVRPAQKKQGEVDAKLEALRFEHERGRTLAASIGGALEGYVARDPVKISELLANIEEYTALLRNHIHVEDHVFYPMARKSLSEEELNALEVEFDKQDAKQGTGTFRRCHKLVVDMGSMLAHMH